ncbi:monomethylamine:corrinoid methyltransferase [Methanolobus sp. ZRKC2]|uniref:monomethylamine:corrinoid methyltransferase n=1 Tax=Methanolobus sp. ZRKC2 TaxID=3125783 RepID=UPI00324DA8FD
MQYIIDSLQNGEKMPVSEHEALIYEAGLELVEDYEIFFDHENLIPTDESMAQNVYEAAIDLLETVGFYSVDTKKVINISREQIIRSTQNTRNYLNLGEGIDKFSLSIRNDSGTKLPLIMGGPNASPVTTELYTPIHRSYAKFKDIGALAPASLDASDSILSNKGPVNLFHARQAVELVKQACALEGRPDLCIVTPPHIEDPIAAVSVANPRFMGSGDLQEIIPHLDLKVNFDELSRVYHYRMTGSNYLCSPMVLLGGITTSSPEQSSIEMVAEALKAQVIYDPSAFVKYPTQVETASPGRSLEMLWASFLASMALSQNKVCLHGSVVSNSAGPCTEMMMYETAVQTIGYVACGCDIISGPVSNHGSIPDHVAGLDAHFMAEVARFAIDLSKKDANYLCLELFSKYQDMISHPDIGKSFVDCYDLDKIEPTSEYMEIYEKAIDEIHQTMHQKYVRGSRRIRR